MDQLNTRDLQQHTTILGWLYIVSHAAFLVIGGFVFVLLMGIGAVSGEMEAFAVMSVVGTFVAGLMAALSLPGVLAGYGLLRRKEWGRILALVVALLNLANFPVGTGIGVYAFWVLLQNSATEYFRPSLSA